MRRFEARSIAEIDRDNLGYLKITLRFMRDIPDNKTLSFRQEIDSLLFNFSPSCQISQASAQQINVIQPRIGKRQKPDFAEDEIAVVDVILGKPQLGMKVKEEREALPPQVKFEPIDIDEHFHRNSDQYQNHSRQQNHEPYKNNQARNDPTGPSGFCSRSRHSARDTQPRSRSQASSSRYPPDVAYNKRSSNQQKMPPKPQKSRNTVHQAERQSVRDYDQGRRRKDYPMVQDRNRRIENRQERSRSASPSYLESQADMNQYNYDSRDLQEDEFDSDYERKPPIPGSSKQYHAAQVKNEDGERCRNLNQSPFSENSNDGQFNHYRNSRHRDSESNSDAILMDTGS